MTDVEIYLTSRTSPISADSTDGYLKMMAGFVAIDARRNGFEVSDAEMRTALKALRKKLRKQAKTLVAA